MTIGPGSQNRLSVDHRPTVSPEVFKANQESIYWIGRLAMNTSCETERDYFDAVARFRANVYVNEMGFLDRESIDTEGRELDEFDSRSVQFAVLENMLPGKAARVVGSGRLILKQDKKDILPIETQFPEVFEHNKIEEDAVEVSRFISRHEDKFTQHTIALSVIRAMTHYAVNNKLPVTYSIVEAPLLKLLSKIGLPLEIIGDSKDVVEPGGVRTLFPIRIISEDILDSVKKDDHDTIMLKTFFENETHNGGEGYYSAFLIGGTLD